MTNPSRQDKKHFQNRKEKSTGILVGIVLVFFFCHILRVSIQVSLENGLGSDQVQAYSHLSNKHGGWNKRGGGAKNAKSLLSSL